MSARSIEWRELREVAIGAGVALRVAVAAQATHCRLERDGDGAFLDVGGRARVRDANGGTAASAAARAAAASGSTLAACAGVARAWTAKAAIPSDLPIAAGSTRAAAHGPELHIGERELRVQREQRDTRASRATTATALSAATSGAAATTAGAGLAAAAAILAIASASPASAPALAYGAGDACLAGGAEVARGRDGAGFGARGSAVSDRARVTILPVPAVD